MKWIRIGSAGCSSDFYRDLDLSEILGDPEITANLYIIFAVTSGSPSSKSYKSGFRRRDCFGSRLLFVHNKAASKNPILALI